MNKETVETDKAPDVRNPIPWKYWYWGLVLFLLIQILIYYWVTKQYE